MKATHIDTNGNARMVNVGDKEDSCRGATASIIVQLSDEAFSVLSENRAAKGDVLTVAKLAGIQAAKQTSALIPLCHPLSLDHISVTCTLDSPGNRVIIESTVRCTGKTGVEMEAMTACSVAALTIYDMLKAVQKDILITELKLLKKTGGKSGDFIRRDS